MTHGQFISFEGIDGAGKSTHMAQVSAHFRDLGRAVVLTREPGGTPLAETLRGLVLHQSMDALTEALLLFAGRRAHVVEVIAPALAQGAVVLCDRFTDATFAYQGAGRGFDVAVLAQLEAMVQTLPGGAFVQPDLTVWFDLPPQVAAKRLAGARAPDRFESQDTEFFAAVRAGYGARMAQQPARFVRIDADQTPDQVAQQVQRMLDQWMQAVAARHASANASDLGQGA